MIKIGDRTGRTLTAIAFLADAAANLGRDRFGRRRTT
jgi:hypothetical protein